MTPCTVIDKEHAAPTQGGSQHVIPECFPLETCGNKLYRVSIFFGFPIKTFGNDRAKSRGDYDNKSDIDVAIIVRSLTRNLKNQILEKIAEIEFKHLVPISTLVLSEDEFENLKRLERRIALDIEREGHPI